VCQSIILVDSTEELAVLGDLIERFPLEKLVWHEGYAPRPEELGNVRNTCFCGLDLEATAANLGYSSEPDLEFDPMCAKWTKGR
jgi:hypothetical protein